MFNDVTVLLLHSYHTTRSNGTSTEMYSRGKAFCNDSAALLTAFPQSGSSCVKSNEKITVQNYSTKAKGLTCGSNNDGCD